MVRAQKTERKPTEIWIMRAPLSIVIPTLNSEADLPATLASLMEGVSAGLIREVVMSDGGSVDNTLLIARETGARIVSGEPSRGGQLRRGIEESEGGWVLLLHADTQLLSGWSDAVSVFIEAKVDAGYGTLTFSSEGFRSRIVAKGANLRSKLFGLPYGDQSLLISRALYDQTSGIPDQPLMEDVAFARELRGRLKPAGFTVATSAARYERDGYTKRILRNWGLLTRYFLGASPDKLGRGYDSSS